MNSFYILVILPEFYCIKIQIFRDDENEWSKIKSCEPLIVMGVKDCARCVLREEPDFAEHAKNG